MVLLVVRQVDVMLRRNGAHRRLLLVLLLRINRQLLLIASCIQVQVGYESAAAGRVGGTTAVAAVAVDRPTVGGAGRLDAGAGGRDVGRGVDGGATG